MKKIKQGKRLAAAGLSGIMALSIGLPNFPVTTKAAYARGDAPFINTWLVAGPSENTIYGEDANTIKRPVDGNWAKVSNVTANSSWNTKVPSDEGAIYIGIPYATDGILTTMWATNPSDGVKDKQLTLKWEKGIPVKKIEIAGTIAGVADSVSPDKVNVVLYDKDGKELASADVQGIKEAAQDPAVCEFEEQIEGVAKIVVTPTAEKSGTHIAISEIKVFDGMKDDSETGTPPENAAPLKDFTVEVSSTCKDGGAKELAFDGNLDTAWESATHQMVTWDDDASLTLTLDQISLISQLNFTANQDTANKRFDVIYQLLDAKKEVIKEGAVECTGAKDEQREIKFGSGYYGVKYVKLSFNPKTGGENHLGFREVEVIGLDQPEAKKLEGITAEANSTCTSGKSGYDDGVRDAADKAIDGNLDTAWMSYTHQNVRFDKDAALTLTLPKTVVLNKLCFTAHENPETKRLSVEYQLQDEKHRDLKVGSVECTGTKADPKEIDFGAGVERVKYVKLSVKEIDGAGNHLGLREVELYGLEKEYEEQDAEVIDVTPKIGESFGDNGAKWEYFDDRIFNRTTDDYNDLFGYFKVKQGINTKGKHVYAHTYVYSPKEQEAELQFAVPGACKVFVNDEDTFEKKTMSSDNLKKDETKVAVTLKEGWNKVLFELYHEEDQQILGLYARFCDPATGNAIKGLEYSVMGDQVEDNKLSIVTQGLDIDKKAFEERNKDILAQNTYPENELPYAYTEWTYVGNESLVDNGASYTTQASDFKFQAAGGAPEYKWSLEKGKLPEGLQLNEDGTIEGVLTEVTGEYPITVKVTDANGDSATKDTKIIVKERPNKWFEEGRMSALSHCIGSYNFEIDPNYSMDTWAERAKNAGMNMLSIEAAFETYYWPAPSWRAAKHLVDTKNLEEVDGKLQPKDGLTDAVEAIKRHGMKPGFYYGFSHGLPGANTLAAEDVEDLILRYDPYYFFFDTNANLSRNSDVRWSIVHSYNDHVLIQHNDRSQAGDNDLGIFEASQYFHTPYNDGGKWESNMKNQTLKYNVEEVWRHPFIRDFDAWSKYHGGEMRDDWRMFGKAIVDDIGHGYVTNYDQMVINERGEKYPQNLKRNVYNLTSHLPLYSLQNQEMMTMRDGFVKWISNEKGSDLKESLFGTYPYTFDYEKKAGWHDDPVMAAKYGEGPEWGYAVSRDQFVYMHMVENQIAKGKNKVGFTGQKTVLAGPFDYPVTEVEWMNEAKKLAFEETTGKVDGKYYYNIKLDGVKADPVDTVLKITTESPERNFKLTNVKLYSSQQQDKLNELQLRAESHLNHYPNVLAQADLTYTSSDDAVASVDENGLVKAGADGKAEITVTAEYEGVRQTDTYPVEIKDGKIHADLDLIGVVLTTDGKEVFGKFGTNRSLPVRLEGRTEKGGAADVYHADNVTWHFGYADEKAQVTEGDLSDLVAIEENEIVFRRDVDKRTEIAVWADVEVGGKTYTTNMTHMWLFPSSELSTGIIPEATSGQESAANVTDGILNNDDGTDTSKWTPAADDDNPSLVFDLGKESRVDFVTVYYNNKYVRYQNAPKAAQVQVSADGETWSEPTAGAVPVNGSTIYNWEDDVYSYQVDSQARYVKLTFPGGAQGEQMDILEVRVMGQQDITEDSYSVNVINGEGDGTYVYNENITVTADEPEEGKTFAGWKVNGKIVSTEQEYTFYVSGNMTLEAVYAENAMELKAEALLTNVITTKRNDRKYDMKFVGQIAVPEGYELLEAGLVWSSKDTPLVVDGELNSVLKPTYIKSISDTNQFSVTIKGVPAGKFLRGQIFAKVADKDGKETYIYSVEKKEFAK